MKTLIASLTTEISATSRGIIQLFPAGEFRARDGRPKDCPHWIMTSDIAARLVAAAASRQTPWVIDYEHQTLLAAKNGLPAPAAGFFNELEWREGDGLYAVNVSWTDNASAMIAADEYRYISPVFSYDKSGQVLELVNAALTNTPALDGMESVMLAAASLLAANTTGGNTTMEELLEQLRWMLNLPLSATEEDVIAELKKLTDRISEGKGTAAASVSLLSILEGKDQMIADLTTKADAPDPAKWVSVDVMHQSVQQAREAASNDMAALTNQQNEALITAALSDGRLLPAQEAWAQSLGKSDPDSLKSFLGNAPKIAALTATQTHGKPPSGVRPPLSDVQTGDEPDLAVCSLLGVDPDDVKKYGGA